MAHLGHGSKAIHHTYSDKAEVVSLPLEFYEKRWKEKIIQFTKAVVARKVHRHPSGGVVLPVVRILRTDI